MSIDDLIAWLEAHDVMLQTSGESSSDALHREVRIGFPDPSDGKMMFVVGRTIAEAVGKAVQYKLGAAQRASRDGRPN